MELSRDDAFEEMGSTWLCLEAELLNDVLRESGVAKKEVRQRVVTRFVRDRGVFFEDSAESSQDVEVGAVTADVNDDPARSGAEESPPPKPSTRGPAPRKRRSAPKKRPSKR